MRTSARSQADARSRARFCDQNSYLIVEKFVETKTAPMTVGGHFPRDSQDHDKSYPESAQLDRDGVTGPLGVKEIAKWLKNHGCRTRHNP
jgi:hypothetical protein